MGRMRRYWLHVCGLVNTLKTHKRKPHCALNCEALRLRLHTQATSMGCAVVLGQICQYAHVGLNAIGQSAQVITTL